MPPPPPLARSTSSSYQASCSHHARSHSASTPAKCSQTSNSLFNGPDLSYLKPKRTIINTRSIHESLQQWLRADIDPNNTQYILLALFFLSGFVDSGAYNAYHCFVSMVTGNTIFAALGVSNLPAKTPPLTWTKSLTSILAFCLSATFFSFYHRTLGPHRRIVLISVFLIQAIPICISAVLVGQGHVSNEDATDMSASFPLTDLAPVALLSFQAAGKVTLSRVLGFNQYPTVVLSTIYHDLVGDAGFWNGGLCGNGKRNERVLVICVYFLGAVSGGAVANSRIGWHGLLWIVAGLHVGFVLVVGVWPGEKGGLPTKEDDN